MSSHNNTLPLTLQGSAKEPPLWMGEAKETQAQLKRY